MQSKTFTRVLLTSISLVSFVLLLLLHTPALAQSFTCGSSAHAQVTFPGHPAGIVVTNPTTEEEVNMRLENLSSNATLLPMTVLYAITPVSPNSEDGLSVGVSPVMSGVATTVPALEPASTYDTVLTLPVHRLPTGGYLVSLYSSFDQSATSAVLYPPQQTLIGTAQLSVEGGAPAVFEETSFALAGITRDENGRAVVTDALTLNATVSVNNVLTDEALRAHLVWSVYEGGVPHPSRLVDSWSEEVRLLPGRDREYEFQFGISDTSSSVYTVVASLTDQVRGQLWSIQERVYSGDVLDDPTPVMTAAYYSPTGELQVCYELATNPDLVPLAADDRAVTVQWTDGVGAEIAAQQWVLSESSFSMSAPIALPITVESRILESDEQRERQLGHETFTIGCEVGDVCASNAVSAPTLFSMENGPTGLHYLLIALAGIAVGILLWLMIRRHERERKAYEASLNRSKQRNAQT